MYLAAKFFPETRGGAGKLMKKHSVCLCDDDNDLEMAMACGHAYVPQVSSSTMQGIIQRYPNHFTRTGGDGTEMSGTEASETALLLILQKLSEQTTEEEKETANAISDG